MDHQGELSPDMVRRARLASLLLAPGSGPPPAVRTPAVIVEWFGAMQSQDLGSGMWSLALRIPGATQATIDAAIASGLVLRTWPMRGTVHLVPPRDARWMVELIGTRALAGAAARREYLGLTKEQVDRAVAVLSVELAGGRRATRSQCVQKLREAGIPTGGQHAYHLLWYVSQVGLTCIGPNEGKESTFVLLDEWAPQPHQPDRDEALAILALRYFRSHGPTTAADFARWLGVGVRDARNGIDGTRDQLVELRCQGAAMYATPELLAELPELAGAPAGKRRWEVLALPGFDEFLLGYKDRALMLSAQHKQAIIPGGNGVFQPTLVRDGRVIGTWRRTVRADRVQLRPTLFTGPPSPRSPIRRGVEAGLCAYAAYLGVPPEVSWVDAG